MLRTNTFDSIRIQHDDFYEDSEILRIEVLIDEMSELEARHFTECTIPVLGKDFCQLRLVLNATRKNGRIMPYEVCAGATVDGRPLDATMKANLRITYLKPLRDAENELSAKKNSRLSQILQSHELLQETVGDVKHEFITIFEDANKKIENWFSNEEGGESSNKQQIKGIVDSFLTQFVGEGSESRFFLSNPTMRNILERIAIGILDNHNLGLGTLNRLFMATDGLKPKPPKPEPQEQQKEQSPKPKNSSTQQSKQKSNLTPGEIEAIKALRADPNIPEDAKPPLPEGY